LLLQVVEIALERDFQFQLLLSVPQGEDVVLTSWLYSNWGFFISILIGDFGSPPE